MAESIEDHLKCPACLDIFRDPVILSCSHNLCRLCLQQWKEKGETSCPICRTTFRRSMDMFLNLALKNLCDNLARASVKSEDMCSLQKEDHQELVRLRGTDAEILTGHTFRPLEENVEGHHKELLKALQNAKERLQDYNDCLENCNEQAEYIKVQKENVERKIKKDFQELRRFLDVEEEARLAAVREEEVEKSQIMKEKIAALSQQMAALSDVIRSTEELLVSGTDSFMKNFKSAMSRIQELPDKPELLRGGLLDEAKHVGNLKFKAWERMKETLHYSPIILDPNTAGPGIILSEDLTSLSLEEGQPQRPKNSERFKWKRVLGGALDSGKHVWDVEVGDNNDWTVGIMAMDPCLPDEMGGWFFGSWDGKYKRPPGIYGEWKPPFKVQRIRVEVDMNERSLSFSEPLKNTKLWNARKAFDWPDLSETVFYKTMAESMEDHLKCPACLDVFKDPVILRCSHNLCRACLQQWKEKGEQSCPICRTKFRRSMGDLPNLALKNLCDSLARASVKSEDMCSLQKEDHQELVRLGGTDAEIHTGHTFRPLEENVEGHHKELLKALQNAKERLQDYNDCQENCNEQAEYIKFQREKVEHKIKKDFEELRRFLDVEEEARLAAVREEEMEKSRTMKEKIAALGQKMAALSDVIRSTEELLVSGSDSFMKNFKSAMSRIQELPDKPELLRGGLLDEAKHVGNLKFKAWERMKQTLDYSPVILDPNTAGSGIILSEDLTSLRWEEGQPQRPKNSERFKWQRVRGCALDWGRHVWDVEVGDNNDWTVGIMWMGPFLQDKMGGWYSGFWNGKYKIPSDKFGEWSPPVKVQRIRVEVDMNTRSLSFSEPLTNTELWNAQKPSDWPDLSGNIKMYPYFYSSSKIPLKIIPIQPGVTTAIR
nr:E3 ubiquitin-protein ligase TRIM35-like [Nerophis lumbriciformis]